MNLTRKYRGVKLYARKVISVPVPNSITPNLNNYMCANTASLWHSADWITNIYPNELCYSLSDLKTIKPKIPPIIIRMCYLFHNKKNILTYLQNAGCFKGYVLLTKIFKLKHKCWLMREKMFFNCEILLVQTNKNTEQKKIKF